MGDASILGGSGNAVTVWDSTPGNLGAAHTFATTVPGTTGFEATLNAACVITVSMVNNSSIELLLHQDGTGGRAATWAGVDTWETTSGAAPALGGAAGVSDRVYLERVNGVTYGYWITAPPAATEPHLPFVAGSRYWNGGTTGTLAMTLNRLYFRPFRVHTANSFDALSAEATTSTATAILRHGLYSSDATTGKPSLLLRETAALTASAAGVVLGTITPIALAVGVYWLATVAQTAAPSIRGIASDMAEFGFADSGGVGANFASIHVPSITGSLPAGPLSFNPVDFGQIGARVTIRAA